VAVVDDEVAVALHGGGAPVPVAGVGGPQRLPGRPTVEHEVAVALHLELELAVGGAADRAGAQHRAGLDDRSHAGGVRPTDVGVRRRLADRGFSSLSLQRRLTPNRVNIAYPVGPTGAVCDPSYEAHDREER
jgi:hypothetical protein